MDDAAVADAFKTYGGAVFSRCVRILREQEAARDVTQEVFVRCFDRRQGLRSGRELLGWLYRVATNLCLNLLRDRKLRRDADRELAPAIAVAAEAPEVRLLRDLLCDLDQRTQSIVVYVHLDGMTRQVPVRVRCAHGGREVAQPGHPHAGQPGGHRRRQHALRGGRA
jgi:RNA polymerase sigma-70 factor (ECF subfamily)